MDRSYKILVADDSESYLKIIQQMFEIVGNNCELIIARNGQEACDLANEHVPDLMLLDVIMPEMNGIEVVRTLRENPIHKDTPIIMLSATESLKSAYEVGANDFISKPFNQYELLIKVRSALNLISNLHKIRKHKAELERKHDEVSRHRDLIAMQKKDIIDDINYSKHIQNAILPGKARMDKIIPERFILNLPRNIVSGDFYWCGQLNGKKVIAAADCTGHGISGAFMTMAGTAFLNEIMSKKRALDASAILNELRRHVMVLLQQKGEEGEASDGMDIALTILDPEKATIQFAGANNPLYYVHKNQMHIIKGDRMPIGIHMNFTQAFTQHTIELEKGDMVYLFSDGYADQFGGPKNKKFRYKAFQDMLFENHQKPVEEQYEILHRTIKDWMGNENQVDDILVLGYRIQ